MTLSIRTKVIVFTFCVVLLVGVSISVTSIYQGRQRLLTAFEKEARHTTGLISQTVINDIYYLDLRSLRRRLENARVNPDIKYTYVMDLEGQILSDGTQANSLREAQFDDLFSKKVILSSDWISTLEGDVLRTGGPVFTPDHTRIGYLQVGFSVERAHQVVADATRTSLYITAVCLAIGAVLAVVFAASFTRPILSLVQASKEIGEGKLDTRLPIKRGDELDTLAQSINHMAANLSRLYDELKNQTVELERANRVKTEFLSVTSHELRTPLNVVMGYVAMIHDGILGDINAEQEKALGSVLRQSENLLTTINSIMEVTKIETGAIVVEKQEVQPKDLLDALQSWYDLPLDKDVTLTWDYPRELPLIKTDSAKLKQVLQNLINNAIKFTDKGHVTISARCVATEDASRKAGGNGRNGFLEFRVSDTGIGIPAAQLPAIFDRFRQVDSSETRTHGGVGVGLYIAKNFTELLGGKIAVESEPGKGSTFTISIPSQN